MAPFTSPLPADITAVIDQALADAGDRLGFSSCFRNWEHIVQEAEDGADHWGLEDLRQFIERRRRLDKVASDIPPEAAAALRDVLAPLDRRYLDATFEVNAPPHWLEGTGHPWALRLPSKLRGRLLAQVRRESVSGGRFRLPDSYMPPPLHAEGVGDGWMLPVAGYRLARISLGGPLELTLVPDQEECAGQTCHLGILQNFVCSLADGSHDCDPEEAASLAPVLALYGGTVAEGVVTAGGLLTLTFSEGEQITTDGLWALNDWQGQGISSFGGRNGARVHVRGA